MIEELKPCPFCGGEAKFVLVGNIVGYVMCSQCRTSQTLLHPNGKATEEWNRRTTNER